MKQNVILATVLVPSFIVGQLVSGVWLVVRQIGSCALECVLADTLSQSRMPSLKKGTDMQFKDIKPGQVFYDVRTDQVCLRLTSRPNGNEVVHRAANVGCGVVIVCKDDDPVELTEHQLSEYRKAEL